MRVRSARAAAAALLAMLGACALTEHFEAPHLTVVGVQLLGSDLLQQRLRVRVHVENPNARELPVSSIEFTLEVEDQELATGVSAAGFTVPARGEAEFDTNVNANLAGALLTLLARSGGQVPQSLAYRISGKVTLSGGLLRSVPFDESGTLRLQ